MGPPSRVLRVLAGSAVGTMLWSSLILFSACNLGPSKLCSGLLVGQVTGLQHHTCSDCKGAM